MTERDWTPEACTLPTAERPGRLAEFDEVLRAALIEQRRTAPTRLCWILHPSAERAINDLVARESDCCSFFAFAVDRTDGAVRVQVTVPPGHVDVLDGMAERFGQVHR
ncbi:hypothetical protein ACFFWC_27255 [Plantactinospora siamensis]|uniref:Arsenate reductase n=1 Tax=Plantactinospora siamensis TaxID=555372 RepID=A0ABV6NYS5_9ACTN